MKHLFFLTLGIIGMTFASAQSSIKINGGNIKINGTTNLVLHNTQFINDGTFTAGTGTVFITGNGTDSQSAIGGTSTTTFYNLQINKSANGSQLQQNIQVDNQLQMTSGNLDLNGNQLTLGTTGGTITGESETSRVTGSSGGVIQKTMDLNAPSSVNPGNIGVAISSSANLGSTTIKRGHVPETIGGNPGINRTFEITPTNNTGLNATARFFYFDAELNGNTETALGPWRQDDTFWFNTEKTDSSTTTNFIETSGISLFSKWTFAPAAIKLRLKINLQGPFSSTTSNMNDGLRATGFLEMDEPYEMLGYDHVASGTGESIDPSLLSNTTANAPVDWVLCRIETGQ